MFKNMNRKKALAIGLGVVISIIILLLTFGMVQNVFTRAGDEKPQDVVITDITQNSAKVTWTTTGETQGVIEYGTAPSALTFFAPESQKTTSHSVDITLLAPSTTYYFQIKIGDEANTNGGVPWQFTTKSEEESNVGPSVSPTTGATTPTPAEDTSPTPTEAEGSQTCNETDCEAMKSKFGKGCTTQDYFMCVRKLTGTPTPTP